MRNWVIWDGDCGFCAWSIDRLMARDRDHRLTPVTQQNCPNPPLTPELAAQAKTGVLLVDEQGRSWHGADAFLRARLMTKGGWWAAPLLWPPIIWLGRLVYGVVARNRSRISQRFFGGHECGMNYRQPPKI
ncbi:MAG: DUF393 domain-containing protein [Chthonomonas sp.]|nr:DUF393 domain-containing protein [Chthonomonas sp.]